MARKVRVPKNHRCSSRPPLPSGFSRLCSGPAPKLSSEIEKPATRTFVINDSLYSSRHRRLVKLGLEADQNLAAAKLEHRPLDHRRFPQHQRRRLPGIEPVLVLVRQFAERRAGAVEQRLPAHLLLPALQPLARDADGLVIMKRIIDAALLQPSARLLHRVAILDAVDGDGHVWTTLGETKVSDRMPPEGSNYMELRIVRTLQSIAPVRSFVHPSSSSSA